MIWLNQGMMSGRKEHWTRSLSFAAKSLFFLCCYLPVYCRGFRTGHFRVRVILYHLLIVFIYIAFFFGNTRKLGFCLFDRMILFFCFVFVFGESMQLYGILSFVCLHFVLFSEKGGEGKTVLAFGP